MLSIDRQLRDFNGRDSEKNLKGFEILQTKYFSYSCEELCHLDLLEFLSLNCISNSRNLEHSMFPWGI